MKRLLCIKEYVDIIYITQFEITSYSFHKSQYTLQTLFDIPYSVKSNSFVFH